MSIPPAQDLIEDAFSVDPSILEENPAMQFVKLVHQSLLAIAHLVLPMVVVIDALDACDDRSGVVKRIEVVTAAVPGPTVFPLLLFFTSQQEDYVGERFTEQGRG